MRPSTDQRLRRRRTIAVLAFAGLTTAGYQHSLADTHHWTYAGNHYWDITSCWSPGQMPAVDDFVYITPSMTLTVTRDSITPNYAAPGIYLLYLGAAGGNLATIAQTGDNAMYSQWEYIGYSGAGAYSQAGSSTHTVARDLFLGYNHGGTYTLTGGTLTVGGVTIGHGAGGTFTQSGGTHTAISLVLGYNGGVTGRYTLSGAGRLSISDSAYIGYSGIGSFIQSAGTHTINSNVYLGHNVGSVGSYSLSGTGWLNVESGVTIGMYGSGTFAQTGGRCSGTTLTLGSETGSGGRYDMSDGTLSVGSLLVVGDRGVATFNQSGGTITAANTLSVGYNPGSVGTYNLSGGLLDSHEWGNVAQWGTGVFNQTGGQHVTNWLSVGNGTASVGRYHFAAGTLTAVYGAGVGIMGRGSFSQSGGSVWIVQDLSVGYFGTGSGTYDLVAGDLIARSASVGGSGTLAGGTGVLSISGGTATFAAALKVWTTPGSAVNFTGGALSVGSLDTTGDPSRFTWTGGTLTFTNNLIIGPGGPMGSSLSLDADMALLVNGYEHIGSLGDGLVQHAGGVHSVGAGLSIDSPAGAMAAYTLEDGLLVVNGSESVGEFGVGRFDQSGGTHSITGGLYIATITSGVGRYTLTGGNLNVGSNLSVGTSHSIATLTIGGGSLTVAGLTRVSRDDRIEYNAGTFCTGGLELNGRGYVLLSPGADKTLRTTSLVIDTVNESVLDLADNRMIVDYADTSPIDSIRQYLLSGSANDWAGVGITSSSAAMDLTKAIGIGEASVLGLTSFGGYSIDATSILVEYTWKGDANLDGQVDISDLGVLATNWQAFSVWTSGDFDYSGFVDISDLGRLASNWQAGVGDPLSPESFNDALAVVGLGSAGVPEPVAAMFLGGIGIAIFRPFRRAAL